MSGAPLVRALVLLIAAASLPAKAQLSDLARQAIARYDTYRVEHYDFRLRLNEKRRQLDIQVTAKLRDVVARKGKITFLIAPYIHKENIESVRAFGAEVAFDLRPFLLLQALQVELPADPMEQVNVTFRYHIPFGRYDAEFGGEKLTVAHLSDDELFLHLVSVWYPQMLDNFGTYAMEVRVPAGMYVTGTNAGPCDDFTVEGDEWVFHLGSDQPRFIIGPFGLRAKATLSRPKGHAVCIVASPEDAAVLAQVAGKTPDIIAELERVCGVSYPRWTNLFVTPTQGGSIISIGPSVVYMGHLPAFYHEGGAMQRLLASATLAHEISHFVFGHLLSFGILEAGSAFLTESLAEYGAYLVTEALKGKDHARWHRMRWILEYGTTTEQLPDAVPLSRVANLDQPQRELAYSKGAFMIHTLRRAVGDRVFFAALRRYVEENKKERASFARFSALFGEEKQPIFAALLEDNYLPDPRIEMVETSAEGTRIWYQCEKVEGRLLLRAKSSGETVDKEVTCTSSVAPVVIKGRAEQVVLDPAFYAFDTNLANNVWPVPGFIGVRTYSDLRVAQVHDKSPLQGLLEPQDRIVSGDGLVFAHPSQFYEWLLLKPAGQKVKLQWRRGKKKMEAQVRLSFRPANPQSFF